MQLEETAEGTLVARSSRWVPPLMLALGLAVIAAVALARPFDAVRFALGCLGAAIPLALFAGIDRSRFEFDRVRRVLRWRRRNLLRELAGELGFEGITSVRMLSREEVDTDSTPRRRHSVHCVVLQTRDGGSLALGNAWSGDERGERAVAERIAAFVGVPAETGPCSVEDLVRAGRRLDAVKQARTELGLGLGEAKLHVDRLAERIAGTTAMAPPRAR